MRASNISTCAGAIARGLRLAQIALLCAAVTGCATWAPATAAYFADEAAADSLVRAIDERLDVMRDVAAAKWISGASIRDATREEIVLQQVAARAQALGLDSSTTQAFFAEQIRAARDVQSRWHAQWQTEGRCAPCDKPARLQAVRERIDAANEKQLAALYLAAPLRPDATGVLREQIGAVALQHGLTSGDATALFAAAAAVARTPDGAVFERVRATGLLRIATTGDYAPFSLEAAGGLAGADVEQAARLAAHLGVEPVFMRTSWPRLSDDLRDGRFDVAMSGISYTPDRAALGLYSLAYHEGGKTMIARCAERARFDIPAELDLPNVRVIVNPGGTNERYVRQHVTQAQVIVHPDNRGVFAEIAAGRADVMVTDDVEAELQARRWRGQLCRTLPGTLTQGDKRILMARDPALQSAVDAWLLTMIEAGEPARALERAMREYVAASQSQRK